MSNFPWNKIYVANDTRWLTAIQVLQWRLDFFTPVFILMVLAGFKISLYSDKLAVD